MARWSTLRGSHTFLSRQQSVSRSGWQNIHSCTARSEVLRALLLRIRVFWVVTPCGWVSGSTTLLPLNIKTPRPFETSRTTQQNSVTPQRTWTNVCVPAVPEYRTNPSQNPRHLYENEALNVRVPYVRSLFKYIITTAISPTKTYTPSRERERERDVDHLYYWHFAFRNECYHHSNNEE